MGVMLGSTTESFVKQLGCSVALDLAGCTFRHLCLRGHVVLQDLHIGEFVLSNELVSMTLAMVSENRDVNTLLRELFTPAGNELYVLPAARYLRYVREAFALQLCSCPSMC